MRVHARLVAMAALKDERSAHVLPAVGEPAHPSQAHPEPRSHRKGTGKAVAASWRAVAAKLDHRSPHRPGSTVTFGVVGRLVFDTTMDGTSLISTVQLCRARSRKRWSVKVLK